MSPRTTSAEQLKNLFQAFRDRNEPAFLMAAESIIAEELAANRHGLATELQQALKSFRASAPIPEAASLRVLPRDRRTGEDLFNIRTSAVDESCIVLPERPRPALDRFLLEHRNTLLLENHGLAPKRKLLFWGPPGCGKTHTAHFLAHALGLPIATVRLHALISSFLGDTASNLQRLFDLASSRPMVLLLDEADAIGKNRDDRHDVGELKRVVNSLLQAIDGFSTRSIVIAATNHQHILDPALWRRFDDVVEFPLPTPSDRAEYLKLLLNGAEVTGSFRELVRSTAHLSFDDIRRFTVETLKTMLLDGRTNLSVTDLRRELTIQRKKRSGAEKRPLKTFRLSSGALDVELDAFAESGHILSKHKTRPEAVEAREVQGHRDEAEALRAAWQQELPL